MSYLPEILKTHLEKHILQAQCTVMSTEYIIQKAHALKSLHLRKLNSIDIICPTISAMWLERWSQFAGQET